MTLDQLEYTPEFTKYYKMMNDCNDSMFITGKAGTGKSTLLSYFCQNTKKNYVILAPTGIAALNVHGQTIHRFFNFKTDITPEKIKAGNIKQKNNPLYKNIDVILIDEISMVRADLLDCINLFLIKHGPNKNKNFGGIQMIFLGDLYQLPPVIQKEELERFKSLYQSPYFFSSSSYLTTSIKIVELRTIYRQKDNEFINLLNKIRVNSVNHNDIITLNKRCSKDSKQEKNQFCINLTTTNNKANDINHKYLSTLEGDLYESNATINGTVGKEYYPTLQVLKYKMNSQIMMLKNDHKGRWVNGSLGVIKGHSKANDGSNALSIWFPDKKKIYNISRYEWKIYQYVYNGEKVTSQLVGTFTQLPFTLSWATTIHKSQGKTFDNVTIDFGNKVFSTGHVYVALSRCTSLQGITLEAPIKRHFISVDHRITKFFNSQNHNINYND